ncbi:hypothetical protein [Yersinia kristensenii]|uniref:hypothetical protein n=1 Tax=Yersinia kristensenii TaxID=28152 RepID=UPI0011A44331|nr:hypothetical protein [Yersinia kristensenii]
MAWYRAGTITSSGNIITGVGTKWLDNKMGIGAGQILLVPGDGTVKMYEILDVDTDTRLRLVATPSPAISGAYAIVSFYTDSVPDFARRLAAQLAYFQSQMEGWQKIMTGTGNVTLILPDQTSLVMPSFNQMNININSKLSLTGGNMTGPIFTNASTAIIFNPRSSTSSNYMHWTQVDGSNGWLMGRTENNGGFYLGDNSPGGVTALNLKKGEFILTSGTAQATPWINLTLQNGWVVNTGSRAVFRKVLGLVFVEASITGGTTTNQTIIFTLPPGYRPPNVLSVPNVAVGATGFTTTVSVRVNGEVVIGGLTTNQIIALSFTLATE